MNALSAWLPWWGRLSAKLVLSRLPVPYRVWQRLQLFRHGGMDRPDYAWRIFARHFQRTPFVRKGEGFVVLELGPGDALTSAVAARALGATAVFLVDQAPAARPDLAVYRAMAAHLRGLDLPAPDLAAARSLDDVLAACGARYLTGGWRSLAEIGAGTVDFTFSQAVLEHVRRHEVPPLLRELRRVLRWDGMASHSIDLKDHLGGGLNHLRFPGRAWESGLLAASGFYTNRLGVGEWEAAFAAAGFACRRLAATRWAEPPLPPERLAAEFAARAPAELRVSELEVLLLPAAAAKMRVA